jgi:hypothetical protein
MKSFLCLSSLVLTGTVLGSLSISQLRADTMVMPQPGWTDADTAIACAGQVAASGDSVVNGPKKYNTCAGHTTEWVYSKKTITHYTCVQGNVIPTSGGLHAYYIVPDKVEISIREIFNRSGVSAGGTAVCESVAYRASLEELRPYAIVPNPSMKRALLSTWTPQVINTPNSVYGYTTQWSDTWYSWATYKYYEINDPLYQSAAYWLNDLSHQTPGLVIPWGQ